MIGNIDTLLFETFKNLFRSQVSSGKVPDLKALEFEVRNKFDIPSKGGQFFNLCQEWYNNIVNLNHLLPHLQGSTTNELLIHGVQFLQVDCGDQLIPINTGWKSENDYQLSLDVLALKNGISWNYTAPFVSFFTQISGKQFRATLTHFCLSPIKTSKLFLRRIRTSSFSLKNFFNNIPFLENLLEKKANIVIAGSTGSGKTSLLQTMLQNLPDTEHHIVLEDTHELQTNPTHQTSLLAVEENEKKSLKSYCSYALRMRPDRIVIGEMRSGEVVPFILAMNTGHKGLLSSIHANSAADALTRLATLFCLYSENRELSFEQVLSLICSNMDYILFMKDKSIHSVIKVLGSEGHIPFYEEVFTK